MLDKLLNKYVHIVCYGTGKRLRRKAWSRVIQLVGFDKEGLINYAKIALLFKKYKNCKKFIR